MQVSQANVRGVFYTFEYFWNSLKAGKPLEEKDIEELSLAVACTCPSGLGFELNNDQKVIAQLIKCSNFLVSEEHHKNDPMPDDKQSKIYDPKIISFASTFA